MPPRIPSKLSQLPHLRLSQPPSLSLRPSARRLPSSTPSRAASSSSYYPPPGEKKGIKIGHLFSALTILGLSATTYGLYQFYTTFTTFPNTTSHPIRSHLRAALRSASTSSYPRASTSFEKAYALALELASRGDFGTPEEALMKTTGIAVKWGGMWEDAGERGKARECYELGWREVVRLLEGQENEGEKEVMRGVAIAIKIGDLWVEEGSKGDREAEKYYVWCVEEMMKLGMSEAQKNKVDEEVIHGIVAEKDAEDKGMELPKWLGNVELVAGFERLGELYARAGNTEYAQPLLQQAIATLLPPPPKEGPAPPTPPIATRCHAATLMNNLSSTLVSAPSPSSTSIEQASRWARQALTVSQQCRKESDLARQGKIVPLLEREEQECEMVAVVGAYNLGKLSELAGDKVSAKAWLEKSRVQAARLGLRDAVLTSSDAIRRLGGSTS